MFSPSACQTRMVFDIDICNEIDDPILRKSFLNVRARTQTHGA